MAAINITPVMKSNTSPAPYAVTASSTLSATFDNYKAFDGVVNTDGFCWHSAQGKINGEWICFDFSVPTDVTSIGITNMYHGSVYKTTGLKSFELQGSLDYSEWTVLKDVTVDEEWGIGEHKVFDIGYSSYRYYRVYVKSNYSYNYACAEEIKFYYDESVKQEADASKVVTIPYILPMNTTENIMSKTDDVRVGLMGMSNDADNFGDLYIVNEEHKAQLAKCAIKCEIICDTTISDITSVALPVSLSKFKKIIVYARALSDNGNTCIRSSTVIDTTSITYGANSIYGTTFYVSDSMFFGVAYYFNDDKDITLKSQGSCDGYGVPEIYMVEGIY